MSARTFYPKRSGHLMIVSLLGLAMSVWISGCARTEIIESPRTTVVSEAEETRTPEVIWTSRTLDTDFDYLGIVKVRSWSYDGALERLMEGGKQMRADALVDVHFERVGFFNSMQAFAVKFK